MGPSTDLSWSDFDGWTAIYRAALTRDARVDVVLSWARAASATVTTDGEDVSVTLPAGLPNYLAAAELRRHVREWRLSPSGTVASPDALADPAEGMLRGDTP